MRVGIDGLALTKNPSGIGKYFLSILTSLVRSRADATFVIYSCRPIYLPDELSRQNNVETYVDESFIGKLKPILWLKLCCGQLLKRHNIDYYIGSMGFLPSTDNVKTILLIHDFVYKIVPQTMGLTHFLAHWLFARSDAQKANYLLTNSYGTAQKISHYYQRDVFGVFYPAVADHFKILDKKSITETLVKLGLGSDYILTVGTNEPRKNLEFTIDNFLYLKKEKKLGECILVIVGGFGWKNKGLRKKIDQNPEAIIHLGYVADELLPIIYNGANMFLFPSLYEGFGMPIREAISCGLNVVTSDLPELREAGNKFCKYIKPTDSKAYREAILATLSVSIITKPSITKSDDYSKLDKLLAD